MPARGNAPGILPSIIVRPERAEDSCALSLHAKIADTETQGVALGWNAAAFSAREDMLGAGRKGAIQVDSPPTNYAPACRRKAGSYSLDVLC